MHGIYQTYAMHVTSLAFGYSQTLASSSPSPLPSLHLLLSSSSSSSILRTMVFLKGKVDFGWGSYPVPISIFNILLGEYFLQLGSFFIAPQSGKLLGIRVCHCHNGNSNSQLGHTILQYMHFHSSGLHLFLREATTSTHVSCSRFMPEWKSLFVAFALEVVPWDCRSCGETALLQTDVC